MLVSHMNLLPRRSMYGKKLDLLSQTMNARCIPLERYTSSSFLMERTLSRALAFLLSIHHQTNGAAPTLADPMMSSPFLKTWVGITTLWLSANICFSSAGNCSGVIWTTLISLIVFWDYLFIIVFFLWLWN